MNKKHFLLLIVAIIYVAFLGSIVPIIISYFNLFGPIYDYFARLAGQGFFFFLYLMSTFFFFPFMYSTLVKERLSFNIDKSKKRRKNPRYYAVILFLIGIPIFIWLILGVLGYYSITEVVGGLGEFVQNGFLVSLVILFYFFICPGIILSLKKNRY